MPSPPITLYMTTIASNPQLRSRQEYILRILQVKKIPYTAYDLASDPDAKRVWRRTAPANKQQLPGILVGQKFMGTASEFEDAVEHDELDIFLRLNEKWDPDLDDERPPPAAKIVGIPGAMTPQQMTPEHLKSRLYPTGSPAASPLRGKSIPVNKRTNELDVSEDLGEFGLEGVKVTQDELADLIAELGLGGDDAGDLAKGLSDFTAPTQPLKLGKSAAKADDGKASYEAKPKDEKAEKQEPQDSKVEKPDPQDNKVEKPISQDEKAEKQDYITTGKTSGEVEIKEEDSAKQDRKETEIATEAPKDTPTKETTEGVIKEEPVKKDDAKNDTKDDAKETETKA